MCDHYYLCKCLFRKPFTRKALTVLLLDCWQREYDKRPYNNFKLTNTHFQERMRRDFHPLRDFIVLVRFFRNRRLDTASLTAFRFSAYPEELLRDFCEALLPLMTIELILMDLPVKFFEILNENMRLMNVRILNLNGTPLRRQSVEYLQHCLSTSKLLMFLDVGNCGLTQYTFPILADGMHHSKSLRGFNCSRILGGDLPLDTMKITYLVAQLLWPNRLNTIEMNHCELGAQDLDIMYEYMIRKESKLNKLVFGGNVLGADGTETILRVCIETQRITHVDLRANHLGTHGGRVIAKYFSSCPVLKYLNIANNQIDAATMNLILLTWKKRVPFSKLIVWENGFNSETAIILRRLLDAHVVLQDCIDVTVRWDSVKEDYRVIPFL